MARSNQPGTDRIYAMHHRWLSEVLGAGDSLLTPGTPIWTSDLLDEVTAQFVEQPDLTKNKDFLEKLRGQLVGASPACIQLMAELHVVHFLMIWNGAISASRKLSILNAILSWMPEPPPVPDEVADVMAPGIAHPGQWAMTRRDTQLVWLIEFSRSWKDTPKAQQERLLADPWEMRTFVGSVQAPSSAAARLALLHLEHPDTFEAMLAPDHKQLIAARFDNPAETEDLDRLLLKLRNEMAAERGEGFDWYAEPLVHRWWKNKKAWPLLLEWVERVRAEPVFEEHERTYKLEVASRLVAARDALLGDDESWLRQLREAIQDPLNNITVWRNHAELLKWAEGDRHAAEAALQALWAEEDGGPVDRLRAFVSRVPASAGLGTKGAQLNIGSFLLMASGPEAHPPMKVTSIRNAWALAHWGKDGDETDVGGVYERALVLLDELVHDSAGWKVPLADRLDAQGALWAITTIKDNPYDWPEDIWQQFVDWRSTEPSEDEADDAGGAEAGSTETNGETEPVSVDHIAQAADALNVDREVLDGIVELLEDKGQVVLYGPPGTGKTHLALRLAEAIAEGNPDRQGIVQFHPATSYEDFFEGLRPRATEAGHVTYERVPGPLVRMADRAAADETKNHVLVIDEINRANLPKVFGELLFLLEYRDKAAQTLYRPETPFRLPPNLWFIGTMNTADRSVALIDAAMRRRFHFVPFFPHQGPMKDLLRRWLRKEGGSAGVARFLDAVNEELMDLVGEHLLIGPSHFMKTDLSDRAMERIWTYNVFPLIEEQLWGNRDQVARWRWSAVRERFADELRGKSPEGGAPAVPGLSEEAEQADPSAG